MDGGPAFRQTAFIASGEEKELSGRASMAFRWDITPRLGFSQDASAFLADNSSFVSTSALTTRLFGALSSRLSFDVRHETERSEEHTSELQSLMRISYAVFCLKKKKHEHK